MSAVDRHADIAVVHIDSVKIEDQGMFDWSSLERAEYSYDPRLEADKDFADLVGGVGIDCLQRVHELDPCHLNFHEQIEIFQPRNELGLDYKSSPFPRAAG